MNNAQNTIERNYTGRGSEGFLYQSTKTFRVQDIAKHVRGELKKKYTNCKFSVTSDYNHINVKLVSSTEDFKSEAYNLYVETGEGHRRPFGTEFILENQHILDLDKAQLNNYSGRLDRRMTKEGNDMRNDIEDMMSKFNYDDSDGQIDYFDTKFYSYVTII